MKVLLVGAAGTVGMALHKELANHGHQVRCVDLAPPRYDVADVLRLFGYDPNPPDAEWVYQDVTKLEAPDALLRGMDAVAYAALSTAVSDTNAQFSVNLAGPCCLLRACAKYRVLKFVYAGSVSVNGPRRNETVTERTPPHMGGGYSVSKWLAEVMLREYTDQQGLRTISLRLGTVCPHLWLRTMEGAYTQVRIDVRDVARAFRMALEDQSIRHDVLHVVSQGTPVYCDPSHAKEILGFEAEFNGPEHFAELRRKQMAFWNSVGAQGAAG